MRKNWQFLFSALACATFMNLVSASAQTAPRVGRRAAAKYFQKDSEPGAPAEPPRRQLAGQFEHVLMLDVGMFVGSKSYDWGSGTYDNVGKASYGLTYTFDQWRSFDISFRADFNEYKIEGQHPIKLSLLPLLTFPEAGSRFPIYFGVGVGPGVFFKQLTHESNLSLDYQLLAGARFMNIFEHGGFFFELGLKNHLHLLSDGQFNGTALTAGAIFTF